MATLDPRDVATFETTVERAGSGAESLRDTDQFDTERPLLAAFHDALDPDDTVWVVGAREGAYAALAAAVVGSDRVAVVVDDPTRRETVRALTDAGVTVGTPEATPPSSPTVVVVDEAAVGSGVVARALSGRLSSVRFLLVKSDDPDVERRVERGGFETDRLREFDPLRTPWEVVVAARRDPRLPVNPVASSMFRTERTTRPGRRGRLSRLFGHAAQRAVPPYEDRPLAHVLTGAVLLSGGGGVVGWLVGAGLAPVVSDLLGTATGPTRALLARGLAALCAVAGAGVYVWAVGERADWGESQSR